MDTLDDIEKIGGAVAPLLKSAAYWKRGSAAKALGEALGRAKDYEANLMGVRGGQEFPAAQREMLNEKKKTKLVQSALQARSAAQGGASDPSVVKIAGDIAAEGKYRQMTALYKGQDIQNYLENTARLKNFEGSEYRRAGEIAKRSSRMSAYTTLLGGFDSAKSLFAKYGPKPTANIVAPPWRNPDIFSEDYLAGP